MESKTRNRTTMFIRADLQITGSTFTADIRCPFPPKTVTISNVSYVFDREPAIMEDRIGLVSCDIVQTLDGVITTIFDGMDSPAPLTLPCTSNVNGVVTFRVSEFGFLREGDIAFALTFED